MAVNPGNESLLRIGLRTKMMVAFVVLTLLVAMVIVSIEQYYVRKTLVRQTTDQGKAIADTIEATAGYYVLFGLTDDLKKIVEDLKKNPAVEYVDFASVDGKALAGSAPTVPPIVAAHPLAHGSVADEAARFFAVPFYESKADAENPNTKPKGYFRLLISDEQARKTVADLWQLSFSVTLLALIVAVAFAYLASRF